ncbi:Dimethyl-sulfide monooxygenase [Tolypocladium paradoxum]|uniref:Dimethyl-sulfide monooxygenase n=1 Tax=Tolypocladium paradoxum TaxID=94208 RepID=A0A2S4KLU8_9HYPO|nr:Dimethyl-sulfide monooxygenase [Tolypocladium paradoxum]
MASTTAQTHGDSKRKLILNAFVESCSGHQSPGLWQHPRDRSFLFNSVSHQVELAKLLEGAKFHGIFIADVLDSHRELPQDAPKITNYLTGNLGYTEQPKHDERYAIAEEYVNVAYKLCYTDPSLVRTIDHVGKYYTVPGPHIYQPSPQRTPVIMQARTSSSGKSFAAKHAETVFVAGHIPSTVAKSQFGRDPSSIKFLALLCPIIGKT